MSKKYKRHKSLSEHEIQRRHELRVKHEFERKKRTRLFWIETAVLLIAFLLFFVGIFFVDYYFEENAMITYIAVLIMAFAVITDRSGLRKIIFRYYPENFLFSNYLKKSYPKRAFLMELSRTAGYFSLSLIILCTKLSILWIVINIICVVIGYVFVLTDRDDKYTFDKYSDFSDTTIFLMITGMIGISIADSLKDIHFVPMILGGLIANIIYILIGESKHKVGNAISIFIFSALNINSAILMIEMFQ